MKKSLAALSALLALAPVGTMLAMGDYDVRPTEFWVDGNVLVMNNDIDSGTPGQLRRMLDDNPQIDTIFMGTVPGSADDEANLEAARMVAERDITTVIGRYSFIASGGTDFFLAGRRRVMERGAQVGVHSWEDSGGVATDYPRGHEYHQLYIDYYRKIGWSQKQAEDFYYYTIESAPADDLHLMSEAELLQYNVVTDIVQPALIYPRLERDRRDYGLSHISAEQARREGIETGSIDDPDFPYAEVLLP